MAYEVHLDVFDGPFALLLQLISAQEVEIYEVRLSDIVDGFLAEMARAEEVDLEVSTEFLLIAATLIELKCRRLLPGRDELDLEEELALYEARDYLLARLVECQTFNAAAATLARARAGRGPFGPAPGRRRRALRRGGARPARGRDGRAARRGRPARRSRRGPCP